MQCFKKDEPVSSSCSGPQSSKVPGLCTSQWVVGIIVVHLKLILLCNFCFVVYYVHLYKQSCVVYLQ